MLVSGCSICELVCRHAVKVSMACHTAAGPCISTDTACSSSLVAVHLAHRGMLARDASGALAGGANALLLPVTSVAICQLQVMEDSMCACSLCTGKDQA
jgi:acyl transferase domain-containing protein